MRQYTRFFHRLYERLPGSLGIVFSFKAFEQGKPYHQVLLTPRRTYRPVMQEHVSGFHCIGDVVSDPAVLAGVNRHAWFPAVSHAPKRRAGRAVA